MATIQATEMSENVSFSTVIPKAKASSESQDVVVPDAVPGSSGSMAQQIGNIEGSVKQTVIRLKRRIDDSPSLKLVMSFKRTKIEPDPTSSQKDCEDEDKGDAKDASDQLCSRVLRLVGTLAEDEADETTLRNVLLESSKKAVCPVPRHEFRKSVKNSDVNVTTKARQRFKRGLEDGRFRLVSSKRGISGVESIEKENRARGWQDEKDLLKLLDLVPDSEALSKKSRLPPKGFEPGNVTCNGVPMLKEARDVEGNGNNDEKGYVYDLYVANDTGVDDFCLGASQIVSVEEADEDFEFGEYRDNAEEDECKMDDDEDSNAEDNWRNDYPDSEEEGLDYYGASGNSCFRYDNDEGLSDNDDAYRKLRSLQMRDDSSSDDDLVYGIEDDGLNYSSGFSKRYAQFRRRANNDCGYADTVVTASSSSEDDQEAE